MTELGTGGPYSPEDTRRTAALAAEAIRRLNHATLGVHATEALQEPADADAVLVELDSLTERLPQLLAQLGAWLAAECRAGRLRVAYGAWAHSPSTEALAVSAIRQYLTEAAARTEALREVLHDARQITAALAAAPGDDEEGA